MKGLKAFIALVAVTGSMILPPGPVSAQASQIVNISGGACTIIRQANGIRVDSCFNSSGFTANDIHITFHVGVPGLGPNTMDYRGAQFGPDVPHGGTWHGIGGSMLPEQNHTLWSGLLTADIDLSLNPVTASGYWTFDGRTIRPIPEPYAWAMMLIGFLGIGSMLRHAAARRTGIKAGPAFATA